MKTLYRCNILLLLLFSFQAKAQSPRLEFVANKGQWDGDFLYKCISGTGDLFLNKNGITYLLGEPNAWDKIDEYKHGHTKTPPVIHYHAYKIIFENCLSAQIEEQKIQPHYYSYFLGSDTAKWKSGIHPALSIDYKGLYKGVDMHLSSEGGNLKYDFIVAPHADSRQIKMKFIGADKLKVDKEGALLIYTSVGQVKELKPVVYQYVNDQRISVPCGYVLAGHTLGFEFPQGYNKEFPLIIDPTVVFSTFSGSTSDNWGFTATYDNDGNMYTGGAVSGIYYPVTTGAFQVTFGGGTPGSSFPCDMAIMKLNPAGSAKVYATYIGGDMNDQPHSIVVDEFKNLVIAGRTYSGNYPVTSTAFDPSHNGNADIVVTTLNPLGTGLVGSTYIGGSGNDGVNVTADYGTGSGLKHNYGDDSRSEVIVDNAGNVYVTAATFSDNFPLQSAIQSTRGGGQDAVLFKLNRNLSNLLFSTYLGGSADDAGYVLTLNKAQSSIFMGGGTASTNFPVPAGAYLSSHQGGIDGYVLKISNGPYAIQRGTFVGKSNYDQVYGVAIDNNDDFYMMGQTLGGTFPVTTGVYTNPGSSQFIMKMDNNLTAPIYSTVYGSGISTETNISPVAFLVDTCQNVYISGWGGHLVGTIAFPNTGTTNGMPITASTAIQSTTDGSDFYFIVLSKNATSLLYGSYFGRYSTNASLGEHVDGGTSRFDKNGIVYQAICGGCGGSVGATPFPTTPGSLSPTNPSSNCNLAALKIAFELGAVTAEAAVHPEAKGCPPFTVNFTNTSKNGKSYTWDFGDGSATSTVKEPTHTFYDPGTYTIRMVVYNPDACVEYDTAYLTVIVDSSSITPDFDFTVLDSCKAPFEVRFENTSKYGKSGTAQFVWDFGDGSSKVYSTDPGIHDYAKTGTYFVTLVMTDTAACNSPDTIRKAVNIVNRFLKAEANLPDAVCISAGGVYMGNASTNATSVLWDFGDGTTSTTTNPTHYYDTGTYLITLIVYNPASCNTSDTFRKRITIRPGAIADFDFQPKIPQENDSIHFTNRSLNALSYLWTLGDGTQTTAEHPSHLYRKTGSYLACLVARGFENCNDTICKNVEALIVPRIDVPTAFTPNGDDINDILYVRGAAVQQMEFTIYNRWGEVVFRTSSMEKGWDGKVNGVPQPMESYAYVLNATFINGETETKRGNITLLE